MEPKQVIPLGAFDLSAQLASGGMGTIWLGRHRDQGIPVAIKVMSEAHAHDTKLVSAFFNEVRAVARLSHPAIVMLLDFGVIPTAAARLSDDRLVAGTPYLVMERLSAGSLEGVRRPRSWMVLCDTLLWILDALAHAHARGVLHRDLKPANLLIGGPDDPRPGLKLIDFGLAAAVEVDDHACDEVAGGTPAFQAPEQFSRASRRDQGPWTDLYGVGCTAFYLATGRPPFEGDCARTLRYAHHTAEIPTISSELGVPEGFNGWLRRMLAKDPSQRFQRAADSAYALLALGDGQPLTSLGSIPASPGERPPVVYTDFCPQGETGTALPQRSPTALGTLIEQPEVRPPASGRGPAPLGVLPGLDSPPIPVSWRRHDPPAESMRLVGAQLGLYGLREVPMVGRVEARDQLWRALRNVEATGVPRAISILGAAGVGKSKLVEWIGERAHELGAAIVLKARHSPIGRPSDSMALMVARHLNCLGLTRLEALERTRSLLAAHEGHDDYDTRALVEIMMSAVEGEDVTGAERVRFPNPAARYAPLERFLVGLSRERPVIVWLDDVHWAVDALEFALHILRSGDQGRRPILLLLTGRDDLLARGRVEWRAFNELLSHPNAERSTLGLLPDAAHRQLIEGLLGLSSPLARQIRLRTQGNPLFAVELIGDWIRQGLLLTTEHGFVLAEGAIATLPADVYELWNGRIDRAIDTFVSERLPCRPSDAERLRGAAQLAVESAAALGRDVDDEAWHWLCVDAGTDSHRELLDVLIRNQLAERTHTAWHFVHGLLGESLERRARDGGRWPQLHSACAEMFQHHYAAGADGVAERIGRHLWAAERYDGATGPLLEAVDERLAKGERRVEGLLGLYSEALDRTGVPQDHIARARGTLREVDMLIAEPDYATAMTRAEALVGLAERKAWPLILPRAMARMGRIAQSRGDLPRAHKLFKAALAGFQNSHDERGVARAVASLGYVSKGMGAVDEGWRNLNLGREFYEALGDARGGAYCIRGLAAIAHIRGDTTLALELADEALELSRCTGNRIVMATCLNTMGESLRANGDLETAELYYRSATRVYESIGCAAGWVPHLNLCLVLVARGEYGHARAELAKLQTRCLRLQVVGVLTSIDALLLSCYGAAAEWDNWDRTIGAIDRALDRHQIVESDDAWAMEAAAEAALKADEPTRAVAALHIALRLRRALEVPDRGDAVAARLASLNSQCLTPSSTSCAP